MRTLARWSLSVFGRPLALLGGAKLPRISAHLAVMGKGRAPVAALLITGVTLMARCGGGGPPAPSCSSFSPTFGLWDAPPQVTITGSHLDHSPSVSFNGQGAGIVSVSSTSLVVSPPSGKKGEQATISVSGSGGSTSCPGSFLYIGSPSISSLSPSSGGESGGTVVKIEGSYFYDVTSVSFGSTQGSLDPGGTASQIVVTSPAGTPGTTVPVVVHEDVDGHQLSSNAASFTYVGPPVVSSVSPDAGPLQGGNTVDIYGAGFSSASEVLFGGDPGTHFHVVSGSEIEVVAPPHPAATYVTVSVKNAQGTTSLAKAYTYAPAPSVTSLSTYQASQGQTVVVHGSDFHYGHAQVTQVELCKPESTSPSAGLSCTWQGTPQRGSLTASSFSFTAPAFSGTWAVTVFTQGGHSSAER